ncbi:permease [Frankia nepalensis]|uniref:permease n=1 Tax=Frankia nepalensis TaxID=1836974 RepID=UPI0019348081|nr:permease [Frankia nepalensis]
MTPVPTDSVPPAPVPTAAAPAARTSPVPTTPETTAPARRGIAGRAAPSPGSVLAVLAVVVPVGLAVFYADADGMRAWCTIFLAVTIQAAPFLALGVLVSGAVAAFVPDGALGRVLPRRATLAVPVAGVSGAVLPGCECSSVPVAKRLADNGAPPAAALTFLLAAPAINPIVLVSTAVAFPGTPEMVAARFVASLAAAVLVGLVWHRFGVPLPPPATRAASPARARAAWRWGRLAEVAGHDFLHAGGFLVLGAALAATLNVAVPRSALDAVSDAGPLTVLALAALAVLLAICSEADAFVAASMTQFPLTARLAFLVVGPMVDVKLIAMQWGTFGRRVTTVFAPLTFVTAVLSAVVVGEILL